MISAYYHPIKRYNGLFQNELKPIAQKYVADHLNYIGSDNDHQVLVSGILSMIRQGDAIISEPIKKEMPFDVIRIPGIERPAWGVAKMLHWLRQNKNRSVSICRHNGFRVATVFDRESISMFNPVFLKLRPGEKRRIIKVFALGAEKIYEQKEIVILWGNHPMVAGNACVGVLPLKIRKNISPDVGRLMLEFNLQGTVGGLKGNVRAKEGDNLTSPVKLDIPDNITVWTRKMVT